MKEYTNCNKLSNKVTKQKRKQKTQTCMEEDEDETMDCSSQYPLSASNPTTSSRITKKGSAKKKMILKGPWSIKSKAKQQVVSENHIKSGSYRRKRTRVDDLYDNVEAKFSVRERADEVLTSLASDIPSFVKCMLPSNVAYGFWLILPSKFCNLHLPRHDTTVILVDECGNEYKTNYLIERHGLSAGWRGFSIAHRLLKGDILVFHLVGPCKLKVHIVRVYGLDEVDAALCLMNFNDYGKRTDSGHAKKNNRKRTKAKLADSLPQPQENIQKNGQRISKSNLGLAADQSKNNSDGFGSVVEDPEVTDILPSSELYCRESSSLHDHLNKRINCK